MGVCVRTYRKMKWFESDGSQISKIFNEGKKPNLFDQRLAY